MNKSTLLATLVASTVLLAAVPAFSQRGQQEGPYTGPGSSSMGTQEGNTGTMQKPRKKKRSSKVSRAMKCSDNEGAGRGCNAKSKK